MLKSRFSDYNPQFTYSGVGPLNKTEVPVTKVCYDHSPLPVWDVWFYLRLLSPESINHIPGEVSLTVRSDLYITF